MLHYSCRRRDEKEWKKIEKALSATLKELSADISILPFITYVTFTLPELKGLITLEKITF